jgi:hypothetical protein
MKTNFIEIVKDSLIGKHVKVYEFNAHHILSDRRITHHSVHNPKDLDVKYDEKSWKDVKCKEYYLEILDVYGMYDDYEGNYIYLSLEKDGEPLNSMTVDVDKELTFTEVKHDKDLHAQKENKDE